MFQTLFASTKNWHGFLYFRPGAQISWREEGDILQESKAGEVWSVLAVWWPGHSTDIIQRPELCVSSCVEEKPVEGLFPLCITFVLCVEGTEVELVKEWYRGRNDLLDYREFNKVLHVTSDHFQPGQRFHLLCKSTFCSFPVRMWCHGFIRLD